MLRVWQRRLRTLVRKERLFPLLQPRTSAPRCPGPGTRDIRSFFRRQKPFWLREQSRHSPLQFGLSPAATRPPQGMWSNLSETSGTAALPQIAALPLSHLVGNKTTRTGKQQREELSTGFSFSDGGVCRLTARHEVV